jgi:hypothetical protein
MFTSLLIAVAVQKAALLLLSVCLATVLGNELLPELPLTAADFVMETVNNTTYVILQKQVSYYVMGTEFWQSIGGGTHTVTAASTVVGDDIYVLGGDSFSSNCSVFNVPTQSFSFCTPMTVGRGQLGAATVGYVQRPERAADGAIGTAVVLVLPL